MCNYEVIGTTQQHNRLTHRTSAARTGAACLTRIGTAPCTSVQPSCISAADLVRESAPLPANLPNRTYEKDRHSERETGQGQAVLNTLLLRAQVPSSHRKQEQQLRLVHGHVVHGNDGGLGHTHRHTKDSLDRYLNWYW